MLDFVLGMIITSALVSMSLILVQSSNKNEKISNQKKEKSSELILAMNQLRRDALRADGGNESAVRGQAAGALRAGESRDRGALSQSAAQGRRR